MFTIGPFRALRFDFMVEGSASWLIDEIEAALTDLRRPEKAEFERPTLSVLTLTQIFEPSKFWRLSLDGEMRTEGHDQAYIVGVALREISAVAVRSISGHLTLHAAAMARNNIALVIAGPSHAGKSTLAAALTVAGWQYLSDDVAPLVRHLREDTDGPATAERDIACNRRREAEIDDVVTVLGFARPLTLRTGSAALLAKWLNPITVPRSSPVERYIRASRLGVVIERARLGAFVILDPTGAPPDLNHQLERLSPGTALLELARCTHGETPLDRERLTALATISPLVPTYRIGRPSVDFAPAVLQRILDAATMSAPV